MSTSQYWTQSNATVHEVYPCTDDANLSVWFLLVLTIFTIVIIRHRNQEFISLILSLILVGTLICMYLTQPETTACDYGAFKTFLEIAEPLMPEWLARYILPSVHWFHEVHWYIVCVVYAFHFILILPYTGDLFRSRRSRSASSKHAAAATATAATAHAPAPAAAAAAGVVQNAKDISIGVINMAPGAVFNMGSHSASASPQEDADLEWTY